MYVMQLLLLGKLSFLLIAQLRMTPNTLAKNWFRILFLGVCMCERDACVRVHFTWDESNFLVVFLFYQRDESDDLTP